jgi:hypothetical protein
MSADIATAAAHLVQPAWFAAYAFVTRFPGEIRSASLSIVGSRDYLLCATPALLVIEIILAHALYYLRQKPTVAQQVIAFPASGEKGHLAAHGETLAGAGFARPAAEGKVPLATVKGYRLTHEAPAFARKTISDSYIIEDEACTASLICMEDLIVPGNTRFHGPVKVVGDLLIDGDAIFEQPVIVDGYVRLNGSARFQRGLVVKSDLIAGGALEIGAWGHEGWAVARLLQLSGELALNGKLIATEGIRMGAA